METKVCNTCHIAQPRSSFPPDKENLDGVQGRCRACIKKRIKELDALDPERRIRRAAKQKALRLLHPERHAQYASRYHERHPERCAAQSSRYHRANAEKLCARKRQQREEDPAHRREIESVSRHRHRVVRIRLITQYHARKLAAPTCDLTVEQWKEIKAAYGYRCVYCGRKMKRLTMDHIIPLSKGGSHTASNIVPACQACNSKKHTGPPLTPVQPLLLTIAPPAKKRGT